jgi:hypothetical protein
MFCVLNAPFLARGLVFRCLIAHPDLAEAAKRKLLLKQLGDQLLKRATPATQAGAQTEAAASAAPSGKRWILPDDFLAATKPAATAGPASGTKRKVPDDSDATADVTLDADAEDSAPAW